MYCVPHECEGRCADQHLSWCSGLFEAGRDVDGIARRKAFGSAGHDLARGESDPPGYSEVGEGVPHLYCRPAGAKCIVFVQDGHAEHSHYCVADELLDRAAVALDDALHPLEVARKQGSQRFRIRRLAQRGRTCHVAEQDRDRLALLVGGHGALERRRAVRAEAEVALAFPTAVRACLHGIRG